MGLDPKVQLNKTSFVHGNAVLHLVHEMCTTNETESKDAPLAHMFAQAETWELLLNLPL